ncbi:MAG: hypothetical protein HYT62_02100 [Candidatus Yanofskybacteria bacterium]|nr:hypothetical protein [Candidatus Yanofskybacteria bacterium]
MLNISNQKTPDDPWLIESFEKFEKMPVGNKADMNWSLDLGFQVFSEYLVNDIKEIQEQLKSSDDEYLYYVCRRIYNILDWINLIVVDAGFPTFDDAFESLFHEQFGDKHILQNMYDDCFEKWTAHKSGQQKIGENFYNILGGKLYYRNRFGQWSEVDKKTAFDIKPKKEAIEDKEVIDQLNGEYKETWYDNILKQWEGKHCQGTLSDDFLQFSEEVTSPEAYSNFATERIRMLLKNPVSIKELERWSGGEITDLEDTIKISSRVRDIAGKLRKDNSHILYLLRDCLIFYEAQKTLDILSSEDTSADQVLIGRKLLSHPLREWGYYVLALESLYDAHKRYPSDFDEFYKDYTRLLDLFASLNPGFATVVASLASYIKEHIQTDKNKIIIFDIGFQGSIALLTKYIIDRHISPSGPDRKIETDIKVGVGALWSKKLFGDKHEDDYFPFLNRIQLLARSNDLYHYKPESLNSGKMEVVMGDKESQRKAAVELAVLVMTILVMHTGK